MSVSSIIKGTLTGKDVFTENIVKMVSGDNFTANLYLNSGTLLTPVRYTLTENDKLYFGIMEPNYEFADSIVKKVFTDLSPVTTAGDIIISLDPGDTSLLLPGTYYYVIKAVTSTVVDTVVTEEINTVIKKTLFTIFE